MIFLKYSLDDKIKNCSCCSQESADLVIDYIKSRPISVGVLPKEIKQYDKGLYYDLGGMIGLKEPNLSIGKFQVRVTHYDYFKSIKDLEPHIAGFYRMQGYDCNLCFTEKTRDEALEVIRLNNEKFELQCQQEFDKFLECVGRIGENSNFRYLGDRSRKFG